MEHRDSNATDYSFSSSTTLSTVSEGDDGRAEPAPLIHALFEELTETWQYVVTDPITRHAIIVDPHLDNDPSSTEISTIAADRILAVVRQNGYWVDRIIHTHESSERPTSAWYLRSQILQLSGYAPRVTLGKSMAAVQRIFRRKYSMNDGSAWKPDFEDGRFADGQQFHVGEMRVTALHLRNGTYAFKIGHCIFAGGSKFDLEVKARQSMLIYDLKRHHIYTSKDPPPQRRAQLVHVDAASYEDDRASSHKSVPKRPSSRRLVIRYAAENFSEMAKRLG
jgi:hypothetical protein